MQHKSDEGEQREDASADPNPQASVVTYHPDHDPNGNGDQGQDDRDQANKELVSLPCKNQRRLRAKAFIRHLVKASVVMDKISPAVELLRLGVRESMLRQFYEVCPWQ